MKIIWGLHETMKKSRLVISDVLNVVAFINLTLLSFITCNSLSGHHNRLSSSPCLYKHDGVYGGSLVDCRDRQLTSLPPLAWIPTDTTSIFLQDNSIASLEDNSFLQNAIELRFLSLANNKIGSIHQHAFRFNEKLRVLDLENNNLHLDYQNIRKPIFYNLHDLTELKLSHNNNYKLYNTSYPQHLLKGLSNLQILSLDTFYGDLYFNDIFNNTTNLTSLLLGGGFTVIRNESFQNFYSIKLKELTIQDTENPISIDTQAYRYLKYLDSITINRSKQKLKCILESLGPFVNRNLTSFRLNDIHSNRLYPDTLIRDSVLTTDSVRYLSQICIKHFTFTHNNLFFIEPRTFTSPTWSRCLVSIDISYNPLIGDSLELMHLSVMQSLEYFRFQDRKYSFLNKHGKETPAINGMTSFQHSSLNRKLINTMKVKYHKKSTSTLDPVNLNGTLTIFLPRHLVYLNCDGMSTNSMSFDTDVNFFGGENLKELYYSDSGADRFIATWKGLENLKILDISKNNGSVFRPCFLKSFPKLSKLIMSRMNLNKYFTSTMNAPIFHSLHKLEHLDLSHNNIFFFPSDIFSNNKMLKFLFLAGNRLSKLPLKLAYFPALITLDIRENSFLELSEGETTALEMFRFNHPHFSIMLDGNVFSCSCYTIRFLKWLQNTEVNLNSDRNYTCTLEDGKIFWIKNGLTVEGKWRECQGQKAFAASISLLFLTILGYPLFFLAIKLKTQIQAACYQYFSSHFAFKSPQDYPLGVYISYSDSDSDFACVVLREFIENQLHLSTYIHHRDLLPASDKAHSIVDTINSSWRILLVVTMEYLEDPWSYLAMKTATYTVSPSNPGRLVIVVLTDDQSLQIPAVENQIPQHILQAAREDSIIKVTWDRHLLGNSLSVSQQEDLRVALLG